MRNWTHPEPPARGPYLAQAEACLAAAAATQDAAARRMHEEECRLWLMLARQRRAIQVELQRFLDAPGAP